MARKAAGSRYVKVLGLFVLLGVALFIIAQMNMAPQSQQRFTASSEVL